MRVWERGVGITLACGSGACAAVYAGQLKNLLDNNVEVVLERGSLIINIEKNKVINYVNTTNEWKSWHLTLQEQSAVASS